MTRQQRFVRLLAEEDVPDDIRAQLNHQHELTSNKEVTQNLVNEAEFAGTSVGKSRSFSDVDQAEEDSKKVKTEQLKIKANRKHKDLASYYMRYCAKSKTNSIFVA